MIKQKGADVATYHYDISSKNKMEYVGNIKDSKTTVKLEGVTKISENGNEIFSHENMTRPQDHLKTKANRSDVISIVLFFIAIGSLVGLVATLALAKDFRVLKSSVIDNIIGWEALFFGIVSIPRIKAKLTSCMKTKKIINKLCLIIMILCIPYFIEYIFIRYNFVDGISNILGVIGIVICIFTL